MKEFELRFRLNNEKDIIRNVEDLDFKKRASFQMSDLIFESREWTPGQGLRPGYFVVRIRLTAHEKPKLEFKEMLDADTWEEISFPVDNVQDLVKIFAKLMRPTRIISKFREEYVNESCIISIDDVRNLGKFIEIEGPQKEVNTIVNKLGFNIADKQTVYGSMLFHLEKESRIKFDFKDMYKELKKFKIL